MAEKCIKKDPNMILLQTNSTTWFENGKKRKHNKNFIPHHIFRIGCVCRYLYVEHEIRTMDGEQHEKI